MIKKSQNMANSFKKNKEKDNEKTLAYLMAYGVLTVVFGAIWLYIFQYNNGIIPEKYPLFFVAYTAFSMIVLSLAYLAFTRRSYAILQKIKKELKDEE